MQVIDTHQHFWQYNPVRDSWIMPDMAAIARNFLPDDLRPILQENRVDGCVAVQADQSEEETRFLLDLAARYSFIKGVVGWIDLMSDNLQERLEYYQQYPMLKGFRHLLQAEPDLQFMLNPRFQQGISLLNQYDFTYDILIRSEHLASAIEFVGRHPNQRFVIDHMAKPCIQKKGIMPWQAQMEILAQYDNVYCKVSGFATEANWIEWTFSDIHPYLDAVFRAFGSERIMYGSDWPVCNLAGGYNKAVECLSAYTAALTPGEQAAFWGGNAVSFYQLSN